MPTLSIAAWTDPIIDTLGHDPRSEYVERFWLPTLGPTTLLLLRRVACRLERLPDGWSVDVLELSQSLGLGNREGSSSPLMRSFDRLTQFDLACLTKPESFAIRRNVPPVNRRHLRRLPSSLQVEHEHWVDDQLAESPLARVRQRARRFAFTLFEQGDEVGSVERTLLGVGFHPSVCRESAEWARDRHRAAFEAVTRAEMAEISEGTNPVERTGGTNVTGAATRIHPESDRSSRAPAA